MSAGRPSKPLFELLREAPERPDDAPAPAPDAGAPRAAAVRSIQVPVSTAAIGVALVLGLVLLAWVGGHAVGYTSGRQEMARLATPDQLASLVINDPIAPREAPPEAAPAGPGPLTPPATAAAPEPDIITATGMLTADPREPFTNYLVLATLDEAAAADAVQFLATRGIQAIAVPAAGVYQVIAMDTPVPSGQFREHAEARRDLERRAAEAGRDWLRLHNGASDFTSTMWALYEP